MAKEIIDIFIEEGYPYDFELDFNDVEDADLEDDYSCIFYSSSIGSKSFSVGTNLLGEDMYTLTLSGTDTAKLTDNLEEYVVYVTETATGVESKLLTGRIHLDKKVRI